MRKTKGKSVQLNDKSSVHRERDRQFDGKTKHPVMQAGSSLKRQKQIKGKTPLTRQRDLCPFAPIYMVCMYIYIYYTHIYNTGVCVSLSII